MKFRPLHDRVVIRRLSAEEKTSGGIIIPDTAQEKPMEGEVIAVGPGARDEAGKLVPISPRLKIRHWPSLSSPPKRALLRRQLAAHPGLELGAAAEPVQLGQHVVLGRQPLEHAQGDLPPRAVGQRARSR